MNIKTHNLSKLLLTCFLTTSILFSCEIHEEPEKHVIQDSAELTKAPESFKNIFSDALNVGTSFNHISILEENEKKLLRLELGMISDQTVNHLSREHFNTDVFDDHSFYTMPISMLNPERNAKMLDMTHQVIDTTSVFNDLQKQFISDLTNEITSQPEISQGASILEQFNDEVISENDLTEEEKLVLLEFSAGIASLVTFVEDGGIDNMRSSLEEQLIASGNVEAARRLSCSIDPRAVLISGVVSFAGGAIWGAHAGATAGTFTVPILGTAVGAIGGAVFGGASGFVGGVLYGIAAELLSTCFRSVSLRPTPEDCEQYYTIGTNNIPSRCLPTFELLGVPGF